VRARRVSEYPAGGAPPPNAARVWNYWLGGWGYYHADKEVGDALAEVYPDIVPLAASCRAFLARAVRYLADEVGIRQFLDLGAGFPADPNTHEVAQATAPDSKIVYVDNDPVVLVHARSLLLNTTEQGVTTHLDADLRQPAKVLAGVAEVLDLSQPVAIMLMGALGGFADLAQIQRIVDGILAGACSGSYLAFYELTDSSDGIRAAVKQGRRLGYVRHLRSAETYRDLFAQLEAVRPGMVPVTQWRADDGPADACALLARKP
jgi:S-adenosyl methyltransferase